MQDDLTWIKVHELSKTFGVNKAVVDLSFSVKAGEVFGLLGPNGAGKTTTIRMLAALIRPTSGEAWVAGHRVGLEDTHIRKKVGLLTEAPGLYDGLSAERNLGFFARLYDVADISGQVERYLRMLGLWDRRHELVSTFSKGMRQKLAIARALLHEPQVLFLDEPTSGLDPEMARLVRTFIQELKGHGRTIVLTTHNMDVADRLCDRVAVLSSRLLALDTPTELRRKLYGRTVVFHLSEEPQRFIEVLGGLAFVQNIQATKNKLVVQMEDPEQNNPQAIKRLVEAGAGIQFVGELRRTLEEVYLQVVHTNPGTGTEQIGKKNEQN